MAIDLIIILVASVGLFFCYTWPFWLIVGCQYLLKKGY